MRLSVAVEPKVSAPFRSPPQRVSLRRRRRNSFSPISVMCHNRVGPTVQQGATRSPAELASGAKSDTMSLGFRDVFDSLEFEEGTFEAEPYKNPAPKAGVMSDPRSTYTGPNLCCLLLRGCRHTRVGTNPIFKQLKHNQSRCEETEDFKRKCYTLPVCLSPLLISASAHSPMRANCSRGNPRAPRSRCHITA